MDQAGDEAQDNEAETTLRVLGQYLTWSPGFPDGTYPELVWHGKNGPSVYLVTSYTNDDPFAENPPDDVSEEPIGFTVSNIGERRTPPHLTSYTSLTEAKAACERHHAIGKWQ